MLYNKLDINSLSMNATSPHSSTSDSSSTRQRPSTQTSTLKRRFLSVPAVWWKLLLAVPLILVPVGWLINSTGDEDAAIETVQPLPVDTVQLRSADSYSTERVYSGELVARRSSDLGFERAGTLTALLVDEGDVVSAGEPLARLDIRDLEAQRSQLEAQKRQVLAQLQELETGPRREDIASAEAAVSDLENQLELAELQAQRRADLFAQGAVSAEELDERRFGANAIADRLQQAQSQLEELRNGTRQEQLSAQAAQVDQIDARIQAIDVSLDKSVLYAPFSGKVSQRLVDEGSVVGGSQQVIRLVENGTMEAKIGVPERVAQRLAIGESQALQVGVRTYSAIVSAKLPEVDESSQTVTVVLEVSPDSDLTIGSTAKLSVSEEQASSGYWLPSTALVAGERGLWSVYVLTKADDEEAYRVARRDVELLHSENDGETARSFVRGLVSEGDRIVTSGTHRIVGDQLVIPSDVSANQSAAEQTTPGEAGQ